MASAKIKTNCCSIDKMMNGGFPVGKVTELCGESGTGKTQICLQTLASAMLPSHVGGHGASGIYLCYKQPFPFTRFAQLWRHFMSRPTGSGSQSSNTDYVPGSSSYKFASLTGDTPLQLMGMVQKVDEELTESQTTGMNYKVIIVDGISSFFTNQLGSNGEGYRERPKLVTAVGKALNTIAVKYNVAVVVTNSVVTNRGPPNPTCFFTGGRIVKPELGADWDCHISTRCILTKTFNSTEDRWINKFNITDEKRCIVNHCVYEIRPCEQLHTHP